jgi:inner membrane protein
MTTVVTHALIPLAAAFALGPQRVPGQLAIAGALLAMLPDADVLGFKLGVAYADAWGHRGATHSLVFAAALATALALIWHKALTPFRWTFLFLAASSHGLLDMLTDGGLGVALFWPIETMRHFFAVTPIRVSPIGGGFFSARGLETVWSELVWVWLPVLAFALSAQRFNSWRTHT